jgi:hypothetical protein
MTPGTFTTPFYRGAAWAFDFNIEDLAVDPVDLTGLGPFVMAITLPGKTEPTLEIEGTGAYDATGVVTFSITKEEIERLPLGPVNVGVRDDNDMPYVVGNVPVLPFPS